jgi:hypothetical protein
VEAIHILFDADGAKDRRLVDVFGELGGKRYDTRITPVEIWSIEAERQRGR